MNVEDIIRKAFMTRFPEAKKIEVSFDQESEIWSVTVDDQTYTYDIGSDDCELNFGVLTVELEYEPEYGEVTGYEIFFPPKQ